MNRDFQIANRNSRGKMRALIAQLTDEELSQPAVAGWTIAATLAHVAFWDNRIFYLLNFWKENEITASPYDVDAMNEAQKPFLLALSPRLAANLAIQSAEAIDLAIEDAPDQLVEKILAANVQFKFERNVHREYHIQEIEEVLNTKQA